MAYKLDVKSGITWIPALVLVIAFLALTINELGNYVMLTTVQTQWLAFIAFVLTALAALLTNIKDVVPTE